MERTERAVLILGDISVFAFQEAFTRWPKRCFNVGINEQAMVGMAAGLAQQDFYPIVHTIAPFLCRRAYEQLVIDFGAQKQRGLFVTVGASYDYAALGMTHGCPEDIQLMRNVAGMFVNVPATREDVDEGIKTAIQRDRLTYIRLAEVDEDVSFRRSTFPRTDVKQVLVIAVGPAYANVKKAVEMTDKAHRFFIVNPHVVAPFPHIPFLERHAGKVLLVEPFYAGTLAAEVVSRAHNAIELRCVGVKHILPHFHGSRHDHDRLHGLHPEGIKLELEKMLT